MYGEAPIIQYKADGVERESDPIDRTWDEDKYLDWHQRQREYMATDCAKAGVEAGADGIFRWTKETNPNRWHSSRFMPRWASRLTLEIVNVRAEQLQDITAKNCLAEGFHSWLPVFSKNTDTERFKHNFANTLHWRFMEMWDALNVKRGFGWDVNPWV